MKLSDTIEYFSTGIFMVLLGATVLLPRQKAIKGYKVLGWICIILGAIATAYQLIAVIIYFLSP